jgi:hypothetical protein
LDTKELVIKSTGSTQHSCGGADVHTSFRIKQRGSIPVDIIDTLRGQNACCVVALISVKTHNLIEKESPACTQVLLILGEVGIEHGLRRKILSTRGGGGTITSGSQAAFQARDKTACAIWLVPGVISSEEREGVYHR